MKSTARENESLTQQQRESLGWLRRYVAVLGEESLRKGLGKVPPELRLPAEKVAERLLAGLLAAYMHQVVAWGVSEERQHRIWESARGLVEEQSRERLKVDAVDGQSPPA